MVKIAPENYFEKAVNEGGKKEIYTVLLKALYGTLVASLLFWKDWTNERDRWSFETNSYETCVIKKTVDGKQ